MPVQLNHAIVAAHDAEAATRWFAEMFGLDFASVGDRDVVGQHYAFLISEPEFDEIYGRIVERGLDHWADPQAKSPGQINRHDSGRGVYFMSDDGHYLEIITRPYGSGAA